MSNMIHGKIFTVYLKIRNSYYMPKPRLNCAGAKTKRKFYFILRSENGVEASVLNLWACFDYKFCLELIGVGMSANLEASESNNDPEK